MSERGFSLIEILVVISALTIVLFISISRLSFFDKFILKNETEKLFATFSFLQQRAIASNEEQQIVFDLEGNLYSYNSHEDKLPQVIKFGFLEDAKGPPSSPKSKIKNAITFKKQGNNKVATLFVDGKVSPGTIYLIDKNEKYMFALTCPISQVSNIRKYKYENNKWVEF